MTSRTLNLIIVVLIGLTLLLVAIGNHLPERRLVLLPSTDQIVASYADGDDGGNSTLTWVDESRTHFVCRIVAGADYQFCGINLLLEYDNGLGLNLSRYERLELTLNYSGDARNISFFMRNYDERYSISTDGNSALYMALPLLAQDVTPHLIIPLSEFKIADWWLAAHPLPRVLARPAFDNVTTLGVNFYDTGNHEFELKKAVLVGQWITIEHWYLMILSLWLAGTFTLTAHRLLHLHRRTRHDRRRIRELSSSNRRLSDDRDMYQQLSRQDTLTGVLNRYGFNQAVDEFLSNPEHGPAALVLLDVDHFKRINDRRGHDIGDQILRLIAEIVRSNVRSQDYFGRWGGEEFILFCPNTSQEQAYRLAEKIRTTIFNTPFEADKPMTISASFGVGEILAGEDFSQLFKRVDGALYRAKREGRNCTVIADGL